MSIRDRLLALCVVVIWGLNFVVIKVGLQGMPPFLLAGLRFCLVALPAVFFIKRPELPLKWLVLYGLSISFGQFALLFLAIKLGMPAGLASLLLQVQAFFTILLGAMLLRERLQWQHVLGALVACLGMWLLAEASMDESVSSRISPLTLLLMLAAALSWGLGNISNKVINQRYAPAMLPLVVWAALVPIGPFFLCSWLFEGPQQIHYSLTHLQLPTVLALVYLALFASIIGYGLWGGLLKRYETWRVAPLTLLVPVIGTASAALLLDERLSWLQVGGAAVIIAGLLLNSFGGQLWTRWQAAKLV
ncbi:EamA family transporter [Pseudomonas sp. 5P_3.1_Bac2]|uniref:EamA family transporter n=1 Tax=Pseudomonas sp. 5P_3.1_Bac2 TaxID=2971617 RepID=UPI0021C91134|nr:EamA family transporter [Pseudomonas sp. 5P_3.1_Bac2]MCU1718053.1 EamA family transporter [Pseudomonas sp. 5P_3.1_Bac2]